MQSAQDLLLAKFAVKSGLVSPDLLEECLREQQGLATRGQALTLIQILVRRRLVSAESLVPITQAIEATAFDCIRCHVRHPFRAIATTALACPTCRGPVTIVREDGELVSERLTTGRRGTQRLQTRADSSSRFGPRKSLAAGDMAMKTFGPYEVLSELGRGGMGVVYKARHPQLDQIVALKVLLAGDMASKTQVRRFQREAELAGKLKHPAIVAIHDAGTIDDRHYFTMDFIEGVALSDRVKARDLSLRHGVEIARDLARALSHAHVNGVIHRDVKPANIIIDADGRPHLTDFGLAREADAEESARLTREGAAVGTPFYMSPEQCRGDSSKIGPPTDVYSLGVVLFEMLTYEHPFKATGHVELTRKILTERPPEPTKIEPAIDPDVEAIVLKVLEKNPLDRYASADAFADDLDRYLRGESVLARPAGGSKAMRAVRGMLLALLVLALLGGGAFGSYVLYQRHAEELRAAAEKAARELAGKEQAKRLAEAQRLLHEAESAFSEADRIPAVTAADAFFDKLRVTVDRATECTKLDPQCARGFLLRGRAEEITRRVDAALQDYARAREADPAGPAGLEAAYREARALLRWKNDVAGAKERLDKLGSGGGAQLWRSLARAARMVIETDPPLEKILAEIETAKRLDPSCADVYHLMAIAYSDDPKGDHMREALDALQLCLDSDRKNARAYSLRARIHVALGESDLAEDDLRHAIALDPEEPLALLTRALLDGAKGDYTHAADGVRRVLSAQAGHEDIQTLLYAIQIYGLANDLTSAQHAAERAFEVAPGKPDPYAALARATYSHDPAAAEKALLDGMQRCTNDAAQNQLATEYCQLLMSSSAIDRAVTFAQQHYDQRSQDARRALLLVTLLATRGQTGDVEKAFRLLDDLRASNPALVEAHELRLKLLVQLGRTKEIDETVDTMLRAAPRDPTAWTAAAKVFLVTSRGKDALAAAQKAVELDSQSPDANAELAEVEFMLEQLADAGQHAKAALSKEPRNARALMILGVISFRERGPNAEATKLLQQALQADPTDADAGYFLALLYFNDAKPDAAARVAEMSINRQNGREQARLWEILGVSLLAMKRLENAEKALRKANQIDSLSARAHTALADCLAQEGHTDEAVLEVNDALRLDPKYEAAIKLLARLK